MRFAAVAIGLLIAGVTGFALLAPAERQAASSAAAPAGDDRRATPTAPSRPARPRKFPNARNTGVPAGVTLTPYKGPCTITEAGTVIDAKTVNCDLDIRAADVTISRSKINGYVSSGVEKSSGFSFMLSDSTLDASPDGARPVTAVGEVNFSVIRSHVRGGNRSANCWSGCRIIGSYLHGQDTDRSGAWHESGVRMGERAVIRGNTIACDAPDVPPDGGCSANLTGYGDFAPVRDNVIDRNLFKATTAGACAYGGSSAEKPFSDAARNIRFTGNVFERGRTAKCGVYFPITDFDPGAPGNVWKGNVWKGGGVVRPG